MRDDELKLPATNKAPQGGTLEFKAEDYSHHLGELDLTEDQQKELLQTLWNIMSIFVDIGWGVDTVQMILPDLFNEELSDKLAPDSEKLLESISTQKPQDATAAEKGSDHD